MGGVNRKVKTILLRTKTHCWCLQKVKSLETLGGIALVVGPLAQGLVEALMRVVSSYPGIGLV